MARITGPRKVNRYSDEFKATAAKLSQLPGVQVKDVAESLDIHPFMLSRWRKEAREGRIVTRQSAGRVDSKTAAELKRLRKLEQEYVRLKEEHEILKKAIRFCSERKERSSRS